MKNLPGQDSLAFKKSTLITALSLFFCATVVKRILCAVALCMGATVQEAAEFSGVCVKSAQKYLRILESGIATPLLLIAPRGKISKLNSVRSEIETALDNGHFGTLRMIVTMLLQQYGVKVSISRLAAFLKTLGYKKLQCSSLPAKANPETQRNFFFNLLYPLMRLAKWGDIKLYFLDASHFVFGTCRPGAIYTKDRRSIRTFSGRVRYNVLGALDYISKEVVTVINETYITSTEIVQMMEKLVAASAEKLVYIVLDNARYQHCQLVMNKAKELGICLVFLPAYSPNLNLIERLWRWVKAEALNAPDFRDFTAFKDSIDSCISKTTNDDKQALDKLIAQKVQLYDDDGNHFHYDIA
jgi:transposase